MPSADMDSVYPRYDVRKVKECFLNPRPDLINVFAHRGLRLVGRVPECSLASIDAAARAGYEGVELDLRMTTDGEVILFHDQTLGRMTDVSIPAGEEAYNPFTGKGYNPPLEGMTWWGELESLHLRDGLGRVTQHRITRLVELLDFMRDSGSNIILQLDVKDARALEPAYEMICKAVNARGVPAIEWCVWKLSPDVIPDPVAWESQAWYKRASPAGQQMGFVPLIFFENSHSQFNVGSRYSHSLDLVKAWCSRDYTFGIELHYARPGGPFQQSIDYLLSDQSTVRANGGWLCGGDLPRECYSDQARTVWDDSSVRDRILSLEPGNPVDFRENGQASLCGEEANSLRPEFVRRHRDHRLDLEACLALGFTFLGADPFDDLSTRLALLGKRNVLHMI